MCIHTESVVLVSAVAMLLLGCDSEVQETTHASPPKVLRRIGSVESTKEGDFFAHIQGIAIDQHRNVYIADGGLSMVKKFNWQGQFLTSIGLGKGYGPGELIEPAEIAVDSQGTLYVADRKQAAISLFTGDGELLGRFISSLAAAPMSVLDSDHIYITRWGWGAWDRKRLVQYSQAKGFLREAVDPTIYIETITAIGMYPLMHALGPDGRIYTIRPYPYKVTVLDLQLNLLVEWQGKQGIVEAPPFLPEEYPDRRMGPLCAGIAVSPDSLIAIRIQRGPPLNDTLLDIYRLDGTFMSRIPTSSFGVDRIGFYFALGPERILVCTVNDPYPSVLWVDLSVALSG